MKKTEIVYDKACELSEEFGGKTRKIEAQLRDYLRASTGSLRGNDNGAILFYSRFSGR